MTVNLVYETFVRRAFGIHNGEMVERWGDPAHLANTDVFSGSSINRAKAATAYSMAIFNMFIVNEVQPELTDEEYHRMDSIIGDVMNVDQVMDIIPLIEEYKEQFLARYVDQR